MAKTEREKPIPVRKRQLNVVYFIDSARTRSFKMPLGRLNLILFGLGAIGVWALVSGGLIFWLVQDKSKTESRLTEALEMVFEYETRYDGVYDVAYPGNDRVAANEKTSRQKPETPIATEKPAKPEESVNPIVDSAAKPTPVSAGKVKKDVKQSEKEIDNETSEISVSVKEPVVEPGTSSLQLKLKIINNKSPNKAEGYVWAISTFVDDKGKKTYIGSPVGIKANAGGRATYPTRSYRFSIRHYKKKKFEFLYPKSISGKFTGIKIGVSSRSGEGAEFYSVPVDIKVGASNAEGSKSGSIEKKSGSLATQTVVRWAAHQAHNFD